MPDAAADFIYNPFILYSKFPFAYRAEGCYTCKRVIMLPRKEVLNMGFFSKMFGSYSDRELKSIYPIIPYQGSALIPVASLDICG